MANGSVAKVAPKPKGEGLFSRFARFVRESWNETFHKSSWPTRQELRQFTIVVIFAVGVVALWVSVLDLFLQAITERIPH